MALTVEDGSIVANANSYVDVAFARTYAALRGLVLPVDDTEVETLLIRAMDYLEGKRDEYKGEKTDPLNQELQWPRYPVEIDSVEIDAYTIPNELKSAQVRLAIELNAGIEILPTRSEPLVIEEKTGPMTTKFSDKIGIGLSPTITAVDILLKPLFKKCGHVSGLQVIRA